MLFSFNIARSAEPCLWQSAPFPGLRQSCGLAECRLAGERLTEDEGVDFVRTLVGVDGF